MIIFDPTDLLDSMLPKEPGHLVSTSFCTLPSNVAVMSIAPPLRTTHIMNIKRKLIHVANFLHGRLQQL